MHSERTQLPKANRGERGFPWLGRGLLIGCALLSTRCGTEERQTPYTAPVNAGTDSGSQPPGHDAGNAEAGSVGDAGPAPVDAGPVGPVVGDAGADKPAAVDASLADANVGSPADAGGPMTDASAPSDGPALPTVADPAAAGPFGVQTVATAPGLSTHTLFVPGKLGENGVKHPIIVWTNGAGGSTSLYKNLLEHFASHGFFVVADKSSGGNHDPEIVEQKAGVEWAIAESARAGSPYFGKIDPNRLGVAGHSLGSIASFATAAHPRVKGSIHWSAGLTGNPVGADEAWLQGLHAPAAFFCGGAEARALPRCSGDFDEAPDLPIFYGTVAGVGHTDVYGEPRGGQWGRGGVAFMRWALAGDEAFRSWFKGADCVLCKTPWTGKSRGF